MRKSKLLVFLAVLLHLLPALSHSGRTNSEGCHNNRKTGGYHCHGTSLKTELKGSRELASVSEESKAKTYRREAEELMEVGLKMMNLRNSGEVASCMPMMRDYKPKAEALDKKADELPMKYMELKLALTNLRMCLICLKGSADYNCNEAKSFLSK